MDKEAKLETLNELSNEAKRMLVCTTYVQPQSHRPEVVKESHTFIKRQLEYLHLQFISLMTISVIKQLEVRPNLDIKSNILGLERTLAMMCEVSARSPQCVLQAY
jgi:hypothetical protein